MSEFENDIRRVSNLVRILSLPPALPTGLTEANLRDALPTAHAFATYEAMEQNLSTGEAIVNGIQTGWYFERAVQLLPTPWDMETGRQLSYVSPWAYATLATAMRVLNLMQVHTGMKLVLFDGDQNLHFPTSVLQRHIGVANAPRRVAVNAGLIASYIARTTSNVSDGKGGTKIVQNDRLAIAGAIESLVRAIE